MSLPVAKLAQLKNPGLSTISLNWCGVLHFKGVGIALHSIAFFSPKGIHFYLVTVVPSMLHDYQHHSQNLYLSNTTGWPFCTKHATPKHKAI